MPKWLLYGLGAVLNFVVAFVAYRSGRLVIPVILALAGVLFVIAAAGSARGVGGGRA
ncbi:MAG TPA: hypothetical protein VG148_16215 [Pyrinomonadaceae bacterium]|nr:hypothetical protein [Pyrinomonadaceae bacterium]